MSRFIIPTVMIIFVTGCTTPTAPPSYIAAKALNQDESRENALYLHLLSRADTPGKPSHRIATTRIHFSQNFSVSFGVPDNPFTNQYDGAVTLPLIDTNGVAPKRPLGTLWNSGDAVLAGRIDPRDGKLFAQLQARNKTTLLYLDGEIELEKPVEEHGAWYRGAIYGVWFVLSENPDCTPYLRALDSGSIRSQHVVPVDSPEAKRWLELD